MDCKACAMKGKGRRPKHCEGCPKVRNHYKNGYECLPYNHLYQALYENKPIKLPPKVNKKPQQYKDGLCNKIRNVMKNVDQNKSVHSPKPMKLQKYMKPIVNNLLKPKGLSNIHQINTNQNKNKVEHFLKQDVNKQNIEKYFQWITYKYRQILYKKPKSITLYLKRNGSVDAKHNIHDISDLQEYSKKVTKAKKTNKRFIITMCHLLYNIDDASGHSPSNNNWVETSGYHANVIIHDLLKKEIYRIEPMGYGSFITNSNLDKYIYSQMKLKHTKKIKVHKINPFKGPMYYYYPAKISSVIWCLSFLQYKLQYPNMKNELIFKTIGLRTRSSKKFFTQYVLYLLRQQQLRKLLH